MFVTTEFVITEFDYVRICVYMMVIGFHIARIGLCVNVISENDKIAIKKSIGLINKI